MVRGSGIGVLIGILPGAGPAISSFMAYAIEKQIAKDPSRFGKGAIEGLVAPEAANNADAQTAFIPTLTLGVPGDATTAIILAALIVHGITPGPKIVTEAPQLFWGLLASFWIGNLMLLVLNLPLIGLWVRLLTIPYPILFPCILLFSTIGVLSLNNEPFEVFLAAGFGIAGYVFLKLGCEPTPLLLGLILGPMVEENFRRSLQLSRGDPTIFLTRPISLGCLIVGVGLVLMVVIPGLRRRKQQESSARQAGKPSSECKQGERPDAQAALEYRTDGDCGRPRDQRRSTVAYPTKPITLVVPFPPGGSTDIVGRVVADGLSKELGQPVVIENRGGAGGTVGTAVVAKAAPDGHTLAIGTTSTHAVGPATLKVAFDPVKGFAPITLVAETPYVLAVNNNVKAKSVSELVALVKSQPGKFNYGSAGAGSTTHLAGAMFAHAAGLKMEHIAYNGNAPATTALLGGEVEVLMGSMPAVLARSKRRHPCARGRQRAPLAGAPRRSDHAAGRHQGLRGLALAWRGGAGRYAGCDREAAPCRDPQDRQEPGGRQAAPIGRRRAADVDAAGNGQADPGRSGEIHQARQGYRAGQIGSPTQQSGPRPHPDLGCGRFLRSSGATADFVPIPTHGGLALAWRA